MASLSDIVNKYMGGSAQGASLPMGPAMDETDDEKDAVISEVAQEVGADPSALKKLIMYESGGGNPGAQNPESGARGLIQFLHSTAQGMGYANADDLVAKNPTFADQMRGPVKEYLSREAARKPFTDSNDLYLAVFNPASRGKALDAPFSSVVTQANPGHNTPQDYVSRVEGASGSSGYS